MKPGMKYPFAMLLLLCCTSVGCATTQVITANSTPARQATTPIPSGELLDVGILPLDPNIPADPEEAERNLIIPDVRRAESSFIAWHLKDTLELTGNWGAVRVTPQSAKSVDLELRGRILISDGEQLKVTMKAVDARGKVWFDKIYDDAASKFSYEHPREDPFQDLYNRIANDLLAARERMARKEIVDIKTVAGLRYAKDLAPDAFSGYMEENNRGQVRVLQLPAATDSMMARVNRIKEQEHLLVDTLDNYYSRFYRDMAPSYSEWRHATYDEAIRLREIKRQARIRLATGALLIAGGIAAGNESKSWAGNAAAAGAVVGGISAVKAGLQRKKEAEIHAESLKEISQSLGNEITPYVLDIEGRTIELSGTAQEQYQQWRELLSEIYAQETSLPVQ